MGAALRLTPPPHTHKSPEAWHIKIEGIVERHRKWRSFYF